MKLSKPFTGWVFALIALTCSVPAFATTSTGPMTGPRTNHAASVLPDGRVLITGGMQHADGDGATNVAELFNPATGLFSTAAPMMFTRSFHASVVLDDGRVMVMGGSTISSGEVVSLATTEIYDPATNTWRAGPELSVPRGGPKAAKLASGKILVMDGAGSTTEIYDPGSASFSASGSLMDYRSNYAIGVMPDDRVVIAGGYASEHVLAMEVRDPLTGLWSSPASLIHGRMDPSVTSLPDGRVLIAGGYTGQVGSVSELFDPSAMSVSTTAPMSFTRFQHTANLLQSGNVILIGGGVSDAEEGDAVLHYDVAADLWRTADRLPDERRRHTSTLLPNGDVLVAGGLSSSSARPQLFNEQCAPFNTALARPSHAFPGEGGSTTVAFTIPAICNWTVSRFPSWISVTSALSGTGSTVVSLTAAIGTSVARSAVMRIGSLDFAVTRAAYVPVCDASVTPSLSETGKTFIGQGGNASVSVTTGTACSWSVTNVPEWITVTSPGSGGKSGSGTATFTVKPNTGGARNASISIANMSYAVQQGAYGSACDPAQPTSISPASRNFSSGAADGNVSVSKSPDCAWSVGALPSWIVARTAMGGVGAATFGYSVLANGGPARSATLTVAGKNHLVTQETAPPPPPAVCPVTATTPGVAYAGALGGGDCIDGARGARYYVERYSFSGNAGQSVVIEQSSSAFDTYVYLKGPGGSVLAQNDDGGGGRNSRIPASSGTFILPATGTYIVEATSYSTNGSGAYTVRVLQN